MSDGGGDGGGRDGVGFGDAEAAAAATAAADDNLLNLISLRLKFGVPETISREP
jgi:ribosomal protein S5